MWEGNNSTRFKKATLLKSGRGIEWIEKNRMMKKKYWLPQIIAMIDQDKVFPENFILSLFFFFKKWKLFFLYFLEKKQPLHDFLSFHTHKLSENNCYSLIIKQILLGIETCIFLCSRRHFSPWSRSRANRDNLKIKTKILFYLFYINLGN